MSLAPRAPYWSAEEDRRLSILWDAKWSVNSIASQLPGRSRNAVTGRVLRLGLTPRPSPIPVVLCPAKIAKFRRECEAGNDAARDAIARAA